MSESGVALLALVGVVASVDPLVAFQPRRVHKRLPAKVAGVALGPSVRTGVPIQIVTVGKRTAALYLKLIIIQVATIVYF